MTIVFLPGCWDVLHMGHINIIRRAKQLGDVLIVGVESDELIAGEKGRPPVMPLEQRMGVVEALRWVDVAIPYFTFDYCALVDSIDADVLVFSEAHKEERHVRVIDHMRMNGKRVVILPRTPGVSSTTIRGRLQNG